jgi:hypothetical protein
MAVTPASSFTKHRIIDFIRFLSSMCNVCSGSLVKAAPSDTRQHRPGALESSAERVEDGALPRLRTRTGSAS